MSVNTHARAWRDQAQCRDMPINVFYAPDGERGTALTLREMRAKKICRSCPVQQPCIDEALNTVEPHGIWGATTPQERRGLRLQQNLGR
ncbi:MAG: WhiB family transcriptional regulator [Mycobacterium sp.]